MTDKIPLDKTIVLVGGQTGGASDRLKMSGLILLLILAACFSALHSGVKSTNMNQGGVPYGIRRGSHSRNHSAVSVQTPTLILQSLIIINPIVPNQW